MTKYRKSDFYLINVTIIEGRHFAWPNMNSYVHIKIGKQIQKTKIRHNTGSPYYNEYFVFEFKTNLQVLNDKTITLTVFRPKQIFRRKKILGYITMDIATVWNQPDHQFYRKWAILSTPKSNFAGPRGYLKVTITILTKGQIPKIPIINPLEEDDIETNLLLPEGVTMERRRALFVFKVYKAIDVTRKTIQMPVVNEDDQDRDRRNRRDYPNVYFKVTFAGLAAKTTVKRRTSHPKWNESLTIAEMYPALCQKIKLELCYKLHLRKRVKCVKYLQLTSISSDKDDGFLPTFGPAYIYFYKKTVAGEEFAGKVLLSLETKIFTDVQSKTRCVFKESIPPILETSLWNFEDVLIFIAIINVSAIHVHYLPKPISFELGFGRTKAIELANGNILLPKYFTKRYSPKTLDSNFWHIDFVNSFPCLHKVAYYPNLRRRLYIANIIGTIAYNLKQRISELDYLFRHSQGKSEMIGEKLLEFCDYTSESCKKCMDLVQNTIAICVTNLDTEKGKYCVRELADIEEMCHKIYNPKSKKNSFARAQRIYERIRLLVDHPQETLPDVLLWMRFENEKVSCLKFAAKDLIYSSTPDEAGRYCGKISTLYFKRKKFNKSKSPVVCKSDLYLWLGLKKDSQECLKLLPSGFQYNNIDEIPDFLSLKESIIFQCRVHIYQGRFGFAFDYTGLSDFFVTVIVGERCKRTKVRHATLNPIWNETLIFRHVVAYGKREQIAQTPPPIIVEITDQDKCCKTEHVGSCELIPVIKFKDTVYGPPDFPPRLAWRDIHNENIIVGDMLASAELLEVTEGVKEEDDLNDDNIPVADDIRPKLENYRLEVHFWGLRDLHKVQHLSVMKPKVLIECGEEKLWSDNVSHNLNFINPIKCIDIKLPNYEEFLPPLSIKLLDMRAFGNLKYIGNHSTHIQEFVFHPIIRNDWEKQLAGYGLKSYESLRSHKDSFYVDMNMDVKKVDKLTLNVFDEQKKEIPKFCCLGPCVMRCLHLLGKRDDKIVKEIAEDDNDSEEDNVDWWTKYYASLDGTSEEITVHHIKNPNFKLKIYNEELEKQTDFRGFADIVGKFKLYRGRTTGDDVEDESFVIGTLKCKICVYAWPPVDDLHYVTPGGFSLEDGFFQGYPNNGSMDFVVRVYCIRGIKLTPKDLGGKCDAYITIRMGQSVINDSKNYVPKNVNPTFGRTFELSGNLPKDHSLILSVWDWDRSTRRDLIGETRIDLENRVYTAHRANCGLQFEYKEDGPCPWRDQQRPTEILEKLCLTHTLPPPEYSPESVRIGSVEFNAPTGVADDKRSSLKENVALNALHNWNRIPVAGCHLVPEHVETRSLYNPTKPGLEQGKIQLWIDVFPLTEDRPVPDMVNIKPRKPVSYELRVTIWNTEEVVLNEDDFFGDRKSDIYIKGWLGRPDKPQQTDTHYRSLNGEGNFNWRFVFPFDYLSTENKVIQMKKENVFDIDETELKIPCRLVLQVWDNDIFSKDDFLGTLTLELNKFPRGAKLVKDCTLKILGANAPKINLFKTRRTRGWWPFIGPSLDNKQLLTGKLDAELELVTAEEAAASPVGLGRSQPSPLAPPKRPETSFAWFSNPLKTCRYIVWKNLKYKILKVFLVLLLLVFIAVAIYSFPGYSVKKILHA